MLSGIFVFLCSCEAEEGPFVTELETIDVSYATDIQPIFTNRCIQCHDQNHPTGLDLREGNSYDLLVNITSSNYAPNLRIEPLSLENSVLWHKVIGDGVFGQQMPPVGDPLSNFDIEKIESWIELGAPDN
ncbi:MAG: hypothetical protein HKN51_10995 [Saprospiraceae bacterium]|nr:hypothetical protein [Saprospiraceae bacterium]